MLIFIRLRYIYSSLKTVQHKLQDLTIYKQDAIPPIQDMPTFTKALPPDGYGASTESLLPPPSIDSVDEGEYISPRAQWRDMNEIYFQESVSSLAHTKGDQAESPTDEIQDSYFALPIPIIPLRRSTSGMNSEIGTHCPMNTRIQPEEKLINKENAKIWYRRGSQASTYSTTLKQTQFSAISKTSQYSTASHSTTEPYPLIRDPGDVSHSGSSFIPF
jgi:hypothetical protein